MSRTATTVARTKHLFPELEQITHNVTYSEDYTCPVTCEAHLSTTTLAWRPRKGPVVTAVAGWSRGNFLGGWSVRIDFAAGKASQVS